VALVLVADDEEGLRSFIAEALESEGHEVVTVADGAEAIATTARRAFDVVVTDLKMPRADGLAVLDHVRAEQPDVEVIVLTAHASVETAVAAMKRGAFDYLQKPLGSPDELRLLVARALERRSLVKTRERVAAELPGELPLTYGDAAMVPVVESLRKVAPTNACVLLLGESGTGKEVAARAVHRWSHRSAGPFVAINCAALAENLLESELFGHEKGAFTGATAVRRGRLELAEHGTFFLDEIGDLKPDLQAKLLRVLQEREFERVGGSRTFKADVRWVAATNGDLQAMTRDGSFREDLFHRLAVFPVRIPPLRERRGDIVPLARTLLRGVAGGVGRPELTLDVSAERRLEAGSWSGNVRELRNVLERAAILAEGPALRAEDLPMEGAPAAVTSADKPVRLADMEREAIVRALAEEGGNRRRAAERLGMGLRTLYEKLNKFGLR
jgi:two-component system response regulator FlrC